MSGRGKPRSQLTFNPEILGVDRDQSAPSSVLDPPPVYPPLRAKPKVPPNRPENVYATSLAKDFLNRMHDSPFFVLPCSQESYVKTDLFTTLGLDPNRFPTELVHVIKKEFQSKGKKRKTASQPNLCVKRAKIDKTGDINSHLDKLEAKEEVGEIEDREVTDTKDRDSDGKENTGEAEEDVLEDIDDEEMDDETDYARDYFDNGEGYLDEEEDNLDEGGIY